MAKNNSHIGSSFDDFLEETGELSSANIIAAKRFMAWQVTKKMECENISKAYMAKLIKSSPSTLDDLLDPTNTSITLQTLGNAAEAIGKSLQIKLI